MGVGEAELLGVGVGEESREGAYGRAWMKGGGECWRCSWEGTESDDRKKGKKAVMIRFYHYNDSREEIR